MQEVNKVDLKDDAIAVNSISASSLNAFIDLDAFADYLKKKGKNKATVEAYHRDAKSFFDFLSQCGVSEKDVSPKVLDEYADYLAAKGQQENSVRRTIIGVRSFYRFLQESRQWAHSPLDFSVLPKRDDSFHYRVDSDTFEKLLLSINNCEKNELKKLRDSVLLHLLGIEGLKVNEVIALNWTDFIFSKSTPRLKVSGSKSRLIGIEPATSETLNCLREFLSTTKSRIPTGRQKILFGFKLTSMLDHLTRHGVKFALYEIGDRLGIERLNSEDLRNYAISHKFSIGLTTEETMNHFGLRTVGKLRNLQQ